MQKLSNETSAAIEELLLHLHADMDAAQSYYDKKSENWQESNKGEVYSAWIEDMDNIIAILENLAQRVEQC